MFSGLIHRPEASIPPEEAHGLSLVLMADPKPHLRWTADLHERFVDTVAQLGGPENHLKYPRTYASPDAIQRTELYEYSKVQGNFQFILLPFQPYKIIYAHMLAEVGKILDSLNCSEDFGREVEAADRKLLPTYQLKSRKYLGPTAIDAEIAFLMANQGLAQPGKLVYDPFVGAGSMPVAAAHFGALTVVSLI